MKYRIAALMTDGSRFVLGHRPAKDQHDEILMQDAVQSMAARGVWVSENRSTHHISSPAWEPNVVNIPVYYPPASIVRFEVEKVEG